MSSKSSSDLHGLRAWCRPSVWPALRRAPGLAMAALALCAVLVAGGFAPPAAAQLAGLSRSTGGASALNAAAVRVDAVEVELVARESAIIPGQPVTLGLRIAHDRGWHTYWRNPGDSGLATELELTLPEGFSAGEIRWPAPERQYIPPLANYGYEGEIVLPVQVSVPAALVGGPVRIGGKAMWLMCREVCIPGEADLALVLPVAEPGSAPAVSRHAALFDLAQARLPEPGLAAPVAAAHDRLSIGLAGAPATAEFFPYREGLIGNAAPQVLFRLADAAGPGSRLEVSLSDDGVRHAASPAGLLELAEGVVVIDGRPFELKPEAAAQGLAGGVEIGWVAGAPAGPVGSPGGLFGPAGTRDASGAGLVQGTRAGPGLLLAALFAAVGGLILNLMPCVFPVIGLKVLGFARHGGGGDPAEAKAAGSASRASAFAFSFGVLASFWLLAAVLLVLRAAGQAAGWGFQLQSPVFVSSMALLFVAIALNFSGVWEFGLALTRLGQHDPAAAGGRGGNGLPASFGSGVLAVLVATPCTAPFMGSALGYTLSATVAETLLIFTALGLGMALPYLLLGLFPGWLRRLPRPGRWMESFRQLLAFPMYATAAWLAWVLGQQAGIDAVLALAIGAVFVALAAWLYGRFVQQAAGGDPLAARRRGLAGVLAIAALAVGLLVAWPADGQPAPAAAGGAGWQPWSQEAVAEARAAGRPVFVDFTAAWCVSCQVNKKMVLDRATVAEAMQRAGVLRLRADWTSRDPRITAELARHGRNGVPLYLAYLPGAAQPQVLPELLTAGMVLDAMAIPQ